MPHICIYASPDVIAAVAKPAVLPSIEEVVARELGISLEMMKGGVVRIDHLSLGGNSGDLSDSEAGQNMLNAQVICHKGRSAEQLRTTNCQIRDILLKALAEAGKSAVCAVYTIEMEANTAVVARP